METLRERILRLACKDGGLDLSKSAFKQDIGFDGPTKAEYMMDDPPASRMATLFSGDPDHPIDRRVFWDTMNIADLLAPTDGWIPMDDPRDGWDGGTSWRAVSSALYEMVGLKWEDYGDMLFQDAPWQPDFSDPAGMVCTVRDEEPVFHGQVLIRGFRAPDVPGGEKLLRYANVEYATDADRNDPSTIGFEGYGDGVFSEVFPGVTHPILQAYRIKLTDRRKFYNTSAATIGPVTDQLPLMDFVDGEFMGLDYSNGVRSMRPTSSTGIAYFVFQGVFAGVERREGNSWVPATVDELFANIPAELLDPGAVAANTTMGELYTIDMTDLVTKTTEGNHPHRTTFQLHAPDNTMHVASPSTFTESTTGLSVSILNAYLLRLLLKSAGPVNVEYWIFTPGLNSDPAMVGTLTHALRPAGPVRIVHRLVDPIYFPYDKLNAGQSYVISELMQRPHWPMTAIGSQGATGYFIEQMVPQYHEGSPDDPDSTYRHRSQLLFKNLNMPEIGTVLFRVIDEVTGNTLGYYPHTYNAGQ